MNDIELRRTLLEQANTMVRTTDETALLAAVAGMLNTMGTLLSGWTGEVVRVRITAEGQPDAVDMTKLPAGTASAPRINTELLASLEALLNDPAVREAAPAPILGRAIVAMAEARGAAA